jgi:GTP-dependent phosphoenolpyruvate carboxykinase
MQLSWVFLTHAFQKYVQMSTKRKFRKPNIFALNFKRNSGVEEHVNWCKSSLSSEEMDMNVSESY